MIHGTYAGYVGHKCRCAECRAANAAQHVRYRAQRTPEMARRHGTRATYNNYGCRCERCATATADYIRNRKVAA